MATVLLIDDHQVVLEALSQLLERKGYDVIQASSGQEGIRIAKEQRPDLIIADFYMPDMSGMDVLWAVRRDPAIASIPVVMLTLEEDPATRKQVLANGANAYVTKSQSTDALIGAIKDSL